MKVKEKTDNHIILESKKGKQVIVWKDASGNIVVETKQSGKKTAKIQKIFLQSDNEVDEGSEE